VWRGDGDWGRKGRLLAGHSTSTPSGKRYLKVAPPHPEHSLTIEILKRECSRLQCAVALR